MESKNMTTAIESIISGISQMIGEKWIPET